MDFVIRGHEMVDDGFEFLPGRQLITIGGGRLTIEVNMILVLLS